MNISFVFSDDWGESAAVKPFVLFRDSVGPALEARRAQLEAMYAPVMGRPEIDPVFLTGITLLQMMERLPDRQAVTACMYDARWRLALGISRDWKGLDPSTLVYFRQRLARHGCARVALEAGLEAMRRAGYLRRHGAVRIDSTHVLADIAKLSRLECIRETLHLALNFLAAFGGSSGWEPWFSRYAERTPLALRNASVPQLTVSMAQAGQDAGEILARTRALGEVVVQSEPVALLQRVFEEQFQVRDGTLQQRSITPSGDVRNPHDPDAEWSTKKSLGKRGWVGYKLHVCETATDGTHHAGEPTTAVITAVVTQPAITSDHGSLSPVIAAHAQSGQLRPETVFADAGYISAPTLLQADAEGYELCGPVGAPPHSANRFGSDAFAVDIPNRRAICPAGILSSECSRITETASGVTCYYFAWAQSDCGACPLHERCLSKRKRRPFRTLQVGEHHMVVQARRMVCKEPEYQNRMHRRNAIEGTHSELMRGYRLRKSRYRGIAKTDIQMQFTATACNLRRWAARLCWLHRSRTSHAAT